jgi:hypothetical protein
MYDNHLAQNKHIYIEKGNIDVTDTLNRLKLKYLAYKSNYYLEGIKKLNSNNLENDDQYKREKIY